MLEAEETYCAQAFPPVLPAGPLALDLRRPTSEVLLPAVAPVAPIAQVAPARPMQGLGRQIRVGATVVCLLAVATAVVAPSALQAYQQASFVGAPAPLTPYLFARTAEWVALAVTGILASVWLYRARQATHRLEPGIHRYPAVLAVLGWWIPLAMYVIPRQIVQDCFYVTEEIDAACTAPSTDGWWITWMLALLIPNVTQLLSLDMSQPITDLALDLIVVVHVLGAMITVVAMARWMKIICRMTDLIARAISTEAAQRAQVAVR